MAVRRVFGDETWRLATEGESEALYRAAAALEAVPGDRDYDSHRARAFALAVEGKVDEARDELNEGWTEDWPFPAAYAADIARVWYLAGDYGHSLDALHLAVRGADRVDGALPALARACVARAPRLLPRALKVALAGGTPTQRLKAAAGVVRARF
jgi:hypothetical protein